MGTSRRIIGIALLAFFGILTTAPAHAAGALDGASLSGLWAVPFAGVLLSIAVLPLAAPALWHHHYGKIALGWTLAFVVPFLATHPAGAVVETMAHVMLAEYLPFLILIGSLFTIAGGVLVRGNIHGSAGMNVRLLGIGTLIASITGTTGAAMLMIRPVLRANDERRHNAHVVIFFIFLVANVGGSLTPLGDPPLFLGFLKGVDFFWPTVHLAAPMLLVCAILLCSFYVLDVWLYRFDTHLPPKPDPTPDTRVRLDGKINLFLLAGVVAAVLLSGVWKPGIDFVVLGTHMSLEGLARDVILIGLAALSWMLTPVDVREGNDFTWGPIVEVAKLFFGIFATIVPVIAMLRAGPEGAFAPIVALVTGPDGKPADAMYFWMSGGLSSFLDNAPTYLVFFNLASGDATEMMGPLASTLLAISAGSVFMGANTYIGNAPNFMVKSIAEAGGVKMPSFVGYMAWSCAFLIPCFAIVTFFFFR
ncbi:MAG: sodium:proton antiporter [Alphaproteobacteria bacterium]|nr:sodium:proton antiporter [Alphaproteobacteria bacterium]